MRGEWIEIRCSGRMQAARKCLSPCGESGLKSDHIRLVEEHDLVSPHAGRVD